MSWGAQPMYPLDPPETYEPYPSGKCRRCEDVFELTDLRKGLCPQCETVKEEVEE